MGSWIKAKPGRESYFACSTWSCFPRVKTLEPAFPWVRLYNTSTESGLQFVLLGNVLHIANMDLPVTYRWLTSHTHISCSNILANKCQKYTFTKNKRLIIPYSLSSLRFPGQCMNHIFQTINDYFFPDFLNVTFFWLFLFYFNECLLKSFKMSIDLSFRSL